MSQDDPRQGGPDRDDVDPYGPDQCGPGPDSPPPPRRDKRIYAALMGTCVGLIVVAWEIVRHFSVLAAVIMSAVALFIPPIAAIIANRASDRRSRFPGGIRRPRSR